MVALLENRGNETAISLAMVLSSKDVFEPSRNVVSNAYIDQENTNGRSKIQSFMRIIPNYGNFGINYTATGINIREANYWEGFMSMIDDDSLIYQTSLILQPYNEISEVFYHIENHDVDFFILLDNEEYDSTLMRNLISKERVIGNMWQGRSLDFHYAPIKHVDKSFILKDYKIAYKKG